MEKIIVNPFGEIELGMYYRLELMGGPFIFREEFSYIWASKFILKEIARKLMSRRCQVTGVGPQVGNNVSHAHNRTKRRYLPNLQKKRIWVQELNRFVTLKLTAQAIKNITKNGTAEVAKLVQTKQIKVH